MKLAVIVQNRWRIPVDLERLFLHIPRMLGRRGWFGAGGGSVTLPYRLEPGSSAELFTELSSVEDWASSTMKSDIFRAEVSLGSGRIAKSNRSYRISKRNAARVRKPA